MDRIKALILKYKEIILYLIVGGCTTVVNWVIYVFLTSVFDLGITAANAAAWLGAVIFAFFANKLLVFESKSFNASVLIKEITSFFGTRIISGVIETFAPSLLVSLGLDMTIFGIKAAAAKLIVSIAVVILNYVFSKLIVFKKNKKGEEQ